MHSLSWSATYAVYALNFLKCGNGRTITLKEIAKSRNIPDGFLSKIMQVLRKNGFVHSIRGKGFTLAKAPREVTLYDVIHLVDGDIVHEGECLMKSNICARTCPVKSNCPVAVFCDETQRREKQFLSQMSLDQLPSNDGEPTCLSWRKSTL